MVRVTTRMLNESAAKAGLPINTNSLLTMGKTEDNNTLLSALSRKSDKDKVNKQFGETKNRTQIERVSKDAEAVKTGTSLFLDKSGKGIISKAKESGSTDELQKASTELFKKAGDLYSSLEKSGGVLNRMYASTLKELFSDNKEALSKLGISMDDGKVSIDNDKLKASGADDFEKVLGGDSVFSKELAILAEHVSDNAAAGIESFGSSYSSKGLLSELQKSRYDFFS